MKKIIEKEIIKKRKLFKENYAEMVGAYKREKETTKDYNGRQLLELIQNADDAGSNAILIKIDTKNSILTISNKGEAFTKEGYRSLMIQNLSSKLKKSYIGNKGLGFRSIINWSYSITIISNGTTVEFSEEKRKQEFHNLFDENERLNIINEFSFSKDVNPLPFLAIPLIKESSNHKDFTTSIEINYRDQFFDDILTQVKDLKEEVLLFLNNIKKIEIQGFDDINDIEIKGEKSIEKPISIGDKKWTVYEKSGVLDDKYQDNTNTQKEHYQLKIAIPIGFENETDLLFTFFPTKVNLEFPFVVHGTFDLDSSRNQLVKSDKNQFVLEKLIELIIEAAKKVSKEKVSWKPLELLNYNNKNKVLSDLNFYENINEKIKELELFPCIDGLYRKLTDTLMYNTDFTNYIIETNNINYFSNLLIPINSELKHWLSSELDLQFWVLKSKNFIKKIDKISQEIKTLNDRVDLIYILEQDNSFHSNNEQYSLLLNEDKKVIDKSISVFTPPTTKSEKFSLPDFVKIDFLNKYFYTKLLNKYDLSNHKEKARELQRRLKEIVRIRSFEPIPVIGKVITETNRLIQKSKSKSDVNIITKNMIMSLYNIHKDLNETTSPDTSKVKVITQSGKIQLANELYLSRDYPSGELTEDLFKGILPKNKFVSSRKTLGLENEDSISVERFLLDFLKVNKHTKITNDYVPENQYETFVFKNIEKPIGYRDSYIRVSKIDNFENIIKLISNEKLIIWLIKDSNLQKQLSDSFNNDIFRYDKRAEHSFNYYHYFENKPSYFKYQLQQQKIFNDLLITDDKLSFVNEVKIDYSNKLFSKYQITKDEINSILIELGAKENFSDLSIERVSEILGSLKEKDAKGKNTQKIYKLAFEHYRKNKEALLITDDFKLFATKGKQSSYFTYSEVYYSDNSKLPKKIISQEAILNFPKRVGESQVSAFFGIKTFKDFKIKVILKELNISMTQWLNEYLRLIKPYLLSIRLSKISPDNSTLIDTQVKNIKSLNIEICNRISCDINNNEIELEEFDFINEKNSFYIKTNSFYDLNSLKTDSTICDLVSEIITIVFQVNENKLDFRSCFRNDIQDTEHSIISEYGNEVLQEAKSLLDMSDYQKEFWQAVFKIQHKTEFYDFNQSIEKIRQSEYGSM
ncbi:sacsin N-terminal ATP-binding-like domain-containing protein, partial [Pontimicrobium sp. MEBiC01747]